MTSFAPSSSSSSSSSSRHRHLAAYQQRAQAAALPVLVPWVSYSAGLLVAHPLDTLRVRWQCLGQHPLKTLRVDGARSLYAGISTPIFGMGPVVAGLFAFYEGLKPRVAATGWFRSSNGTLDAHSQHHQSAMPQYTAAEHFVAGAVAGAVAAQAACPMFVLRVQQQNSAVGGNRAMSLGAAFQRVVSAEGVRGLYRGNSLVTLNESLARGSFFASYNTLKRVIDGTGLAPTPLARDIAASWAAALAFVTVSFPLVTVATRVATDEPATASLRGLPRIAAAFRAVCEPHGPRIGLTRGVSIALVRSACWMSIQMPLYDFLSRRLLVTPNSNSAAASKKTSTTRA